MALTVHKPMEGCQVATWNKRNILFGQPPEVVKALINANLDNLDTLVLPDVRERQGILLNSLEFPLYYFLFFAGGLAEGRRLNLVGNEDAIHQALALLRLTMLGERPEIMERWTLEEEIKQDIYNASTFFALKDEHGDIREIDSFFTLCPFHNNVANLVDYTIERTSMDCFKVTAGSETTAIDLNHPSKIEPPYYIHSDLTPNDLVKLGLIILGGASGFSPHEASTGMVLCFNGNYMLIDSIPFLDHHLFARGISKNQIYSLFLTHLHDDHCSMFPLLHMPHKVDVISTKEIYGMAMKKLSLGLGWQESAIREHFTLIELKPGKTLDYYGLRINAHYTIHSIPTIGATFWTTHAGAQYRLCVVGDNQSFSEINHMYQQKLVRTEVAETLIQLYREDFDLLIADGGMGQIHGNPADALESQADRVIFVHLDALPEEFNATFSLASAGKRYTVVQGDCDFHTTRCIEFLMSSFHQQPSPRWISTLLADMCIRHYNKDDVIIKQGDQTRNIVYMMLTGYSKVVIHDGKSFTQVATLEAGNFIGEMAVVTGTELRNASVIASTPVIVCEFSEATFAAFVKEEGLRDELLSIWSHRQLVYQVPQFANLGSRVVEAISYYAEPLVLPKAATLNLSENGDVWAVLLSGALRCAESGQVLNQKGDEAGGYRPYAAPGATMLICETEAQMLRFSAADTQKLLADVPRFSYEMRKYRYDQTSRSTLSQKTRERAHP